MSCRRNQYMGITHPNTTTTVDRFRPPRSPPCTQHRHPGPQTNQWEHIGHKCPAKYSDSDAKIPENFQRYKKFLEKNCAVSNVKKFCKEGHEGAAILQEVTDKTFNIGDSSNVDDVDNVQICGDVKDPSNLERPKTPTHVRTVEVACVGLDLIIGEETFTLVELGHYKMNGTPNLRAQAYFSEKINPGDIKQPNKVLKRALNEELAMNTTWSTNSESPVGTMSEGQLGMTCQLYTPSGWCRRPFLQVKEKVQWQGFGAECDIMSIYKLFGFHVSWILTKKGNVFDTLKDKLEKDRSVLVQWEGKMEFTLFVKEENKINMFALLQLPPTYYPNTGPWKEDGCTRDSRMETASHMGVWKRHLEEDPRIQQLRELSLSTCRDLLALKFKNKVKSWLGHLDLRHVKDEFSGLFDAALTELQNHPPLGKEWYLKDNQAPRDWLEQIIVEQRPDLKKIIVEHKNVEYEPPRSRAGKGKAGKKKKKAGKGGGVKR